AFGEVLLRLVAVVVAPADLPPAPLAVDAGRVQLVLPAAALAGHQAVLGFLVVPAGMVLWVAQMPPVVDGHGVLAGRGAGAGQPLRRWRRQAISFRSAAMCSIMSPIRVDCRCC